MIEQIAMFGAGSLGLGAVTGYAIKKVVKIAAIIIGLFIAALAFLEYHKIVMVNWNVASTTANDTLTTVYHQAMITVQQAAGHVNAVLGVAGGGFVVGFLIGFARG